MFIHRILPLLGVVLLVLSACAQRQEEHLESTYAGEGSFKAVGTPADCSPYVLKARQEERPVMLEFVRELPHAIFSCQYWRGKPIRYFGNMGKKLKFRRADGSKQVVYAGFGYALADLTKEVEELLTKVNVRESLGFSRGKFEVQVREDPTEIPGYGQTRTFYVEVSGPYIRNRTIAALTVFDFPRLDVKFRTFLWVQAYSVTKASAARIFGYLLEGIEAPRVQQAQRWYSAAP